MYCIGIIGKRVSSYSQQPLVVFESETKYLQEQTGGCVLFGEKPISVRLIQAIEREIMAEIRSQAEVDATFRSDIRKQHAQSRGTCVHNIQTYMYTGA